MFDVGTEDRIMSYIPGKNRQLWFFELECTGSLIGLRCIDNKWGSGGLNY